LIPVFLCGKGFDPDEEDGDVVFATVVFSKADETLGGSPWIRGLAQDFAEKVLADFIGEAICAEQETVAGLEWHAKQVRFRRAFGAEGAGEDHRRSRSWIGAVFNEDIMVLSDADEDAAPENVSPAVADLGDISVGANNGDGDRGARHIRVFRVLLPFIIDVAAGDADGAFQGLWGLFPGSRLVVHFPDAIHGEASGAGTAGAPAHAIGNDE